MSFSLSRSLRKLGGYIGDFFESSLDHLEEEFKRFLKNYVAPLFEPVFEILGITDETVYQTEVVVTPLLDLQNSNFKSVILNSIQKDLDIVGTLKEEFLTGHRATVRSYYNYGKGKFIDSLPSIDVAAFQPNKEDIQNAIETEVGESVTVIYATKGDPDLEVWVKRYLIEQYDYNPTTNELMYNGYPYEFYSVRLNSYLNRLIVRIRRLGQTTFRKYRFTDISTEAGVETTWIYDRAYWQYDFSDGHPQVTRWGFTDTQSITTQSGDGSNDGITSVITYEEVRAGYYLIDMEQLFVVPDPEDTYYSATYYLNSNPNTTNVWTYNTADGFYPALDDFLLGGDANEIEPLPIVTLRQDFESIDVDKNSDRYKQSKRILEILRLISLDSLLEAISQNESIDQIQDAFVLFGVNLYTEEQHSIKYLYEFFSVLHEAHGINRNDFIARTPLEQSQSVFFINLFEGRFNTNISFKYINTETKAGRIGRVGYYETAVTETPNIHSQLEDDILNYTEDSYDGSITSTFTIRKQVSDNTYIEMDVVGLLLTTAIVTRGTRVDITKVELKDPSTLTQEEKNKFTVPVCLAILDALSLYESEQVVYDSLCLSIYAKDSQHLEYYQTPEFLEFVGVLIQVVSIIVLIVSLGSASSVSAMLWSLAEYLLMQYALKLALKEILTHNLNDTEKAAVLALYAAASVYTFDFAFGEQFSVSLIDQLLLAVNSISTGIQIDADLQTESLQEEITEFNTLVSSKEEELKAAQSFLNLDGSIDTFQLLATSNSPIIDTWSSPSEFISKSLMGNLAPIVLNQPHNFVESSLDLNNIRPAFDIRPIDTDLYT